MAAELGRFIAVLRGLGAVGGPAAGTHNFFRGVPPAARDVETRAAIAALSEEIDVGAASAVWETATGAPAWDGPAAWVHGDLLPGIYWSFV